VYHIDARPKGACDLSIVVPTYNERDRLEELVAAVARVFAAHGIAGELVVVDDNSPDGTGTIADALTDRYPVQVVHREGKLGLGSAVIAGFATARGGVLGVMDADLSHPPSILPGMLAALRALDVDVVIGSRYIPGGASKNWPLLRLAMSRFACALAWPLTPVRDATSGLFLVKKAAIEGVKISAAGFKICLELLMRSRIASVAEVPYVFADRAAGESKMTLREALGYFAQLRDLYALAFLGGRKPRAEYHRVSPPGLEALVRAAFGSPSSTR
jgi:dolichol-phosphate mannosyltransferase